MNTDPTPDANEIKRAVSTLHPGDGIIELRAIYKGGRKRIDSGYFDAAHRELLVSEAMRLNRDAAAAVYINLNEIDSQLLARHANRIEPHASATATDANVTRRRWLLIDIDPQRPKDTSATPEQLALATKRARAAVEYLTKRGWPKPVSADSGNGLHLFYVIDLPNDKASTDLIKACLEALAARFDDDAVKIDRSVHNAARIVKLHGTVANKGDNLPAAPWRLSRLRVVPDPLTVVTVEQLQALAAEGKQGEAPKGNGAGKGNGGMHFDSGTSWTAEDVAAFLTRGAIEYEGPEPHEGGQRWKLKHCPFNADHGFGDAAVFLQPSGRLGFKCLHNGCADKHWLELRELVDGPRTPRSRIDLSQLSQRSSPPIPLVRPVPPSALYPIDALGPVLGQAARAIAEIVQVPAAMAGNTVLASAALAAQALANVQTLAGPRPLSLYVLTVAGSGDRKTAADDVALAPVRATVRRSAIAYEVAVREHERAAAARKLDRSRARKEAKDGDAYAATLKEIADEPAPRKPSLICSEPTAEGLVRSLAEGQFSQGIFTDEGGQFLGGHALSEEAELRTVAMLSRLWQGTTIDRVRATDHEHLVLYGRRLSMHLMAQPAVASRLLGRDLYRSQGFLARWLIAAPESLAGTRTHDRTRPAAVDDPRVRRYCYAIAQLLEYPAVEDHEVGGLDPPCLVLSVEARSLLIEAYDEVEQDQRAGGALELVRDWASKAAEHACRLAGVLTLSGKPDAVEVSVETMRHALMLVEFHLSEFARLVGASGVSAEIERAQVLLDWLRRKKRETITPRQVMQYGPGSIRSADMARAALRTLAAYGWLSTEDDKTYTVDAAVFADDKP